MAKTLLSLWHDNFDRQEGSDKKPDSAASGNKNRGLRQINEFNDQRGALGLDGQLSSDNPIPAGKAFSILGMLGSTILGQQGVNAAAKEIFDPKLPNQSKFGNDDMTFDTFFKAATVMERVLQNNRLVQSPSNTVYSEKSGDNPYEQVTKEFPDISFQRSVVRQNFRIGAQEGELDTWKKFTNRAFNDLVPNKSRQSSVLDFNAFGQLDN